jgi:hypothetical protein
VGLKRLLGKSNEISLIKSMQNHAWNKSVEYISNNSSVETQYFDCHWRLRDLAYSMAPKDGLFLEFGVYKGKSITYFAQKNPKIKLFGFDSFEGFSEEWGGVSDQYSKVCFSQNGYLPEVPENVTLIKGFVEETLPNFIQQKTSRISFVHIDTDTFSPCYTILNELKPHFQHGTILLFDELVGYPNYQSHELKALEMVLDRDEYEFIGFAKLLGPGQLVKAAIRIIK